VTAVLGVISCYWYKAPAYFSVASTSASTSLFPGLVNITAVCYYIELIGAINFTLKIRCRRRYDLLQIAIITSWCRLFTAMHDRTPCTCRSYLAHTATGFTWALSYSQHASQLFLQFQANYHGSATENHLHHLVQYLALYCLSRGIRKSSCMARLSVLCSITRASPIAGVCLFVCLLSLLSSCGRILNRIWWNFAQSFGAGKTKIEFVMGQNPIM